MTTEQSASMDAALNDVFSPGRGRHDDTATPEVAETIQTPAATPEAAPQTEAEREDPVDHNKQVSVKEVFDEREKKRAYKAQFEAEKQRATTFEAELRALKEQNQQLLQTFGSRPQLTAAPAQQRQPVQAPDPVVDPVGYHNFINAQIQERLLVRDLNNSEERARDKHGDSAVDAAFKAAESVFSQADWRSLMNKRHPYGELVNWHKSHQTIQTVGTDLEAYKQKLEAEVRAKVLEELKSGKAPVVPGQTQQQAPQSFPGTLAAATQQGPTGQNTKNLEAATGDVFAPDRKVRGMRR